MFVSRECKYCHELIQNIQKKPDLAKLIKVVSIENTPKLPEGLTNVPALLVDKKLMMGNSCFEFVDKYGDLEAGFVNPTSLSDSFSYIDNSSSDQSNGYYSYLDGPSGPSGPSGGQGQGGKQGRSNGLSMDDIQKQRDKEVSNMIHTGRGY